MEQWNYSNMSKDEQEQMLNALQEKCSQEEYLCHVLFFLYACQQPGKKKYLIFENENYINTFNEYVEKISPDSEVYLIPVAEEEALYENAVKAYLEELKNEKKFFDIIFYPAWLGAGNDAIDLYVELLAPKGIIIMHGKENIGIPKELSEERRVDSGDIHYLVLADSRNIIPSATRRIIGAITEIRDSQVDNDDVLVGLISMISALEDYIQENRDDQKIHDYCYHVNEIKNALLDIYVEKSRRDGLVQVLYELLEHIESVVCL